MTDEPLEQLAQLRAHAVDEARLALREAQRARVACRQARDAALAAEAARDHALGEARARFVSANSVTALRWSARCMERELARRERERAVLVQREQRLLEATTRAHASARALAARELERRAIARTLSRRAESVTRRTEARLEDDADDVFRARAHRP